jgi:hypothetical protein
MHGWWVLMGAVIAVGAVFAPKILRHHRRRAQVDRVRAALSAWLPALNQPDGAQPSGVVAPPTFGLAPSGPSVVRCRRTLMFGELDPDISVGSRRAA